MSITREQQVEICRAAGTAHGENCWCKNCSLLVTNSTRIVWPDLLTGEGAWALLDAMRARGWLASIIDEARGVQVNFWHPFAGTFTAAHADRAEAIARACAAALGVKLD